MPRRILIVGGDSTIGTALAQHFALAGDDVLATTRRSEVASASRPLLDLREPSSRWPDLEADVAFVCAAQTSIARCEEDPGGTYAINVDATGALLRGLYEVCDFVVLPSTSLVFSGERAGCAPGDELSPLTAYGQQKAELERFATQTAGDRTCVVRIGKVVSARVPLFARWCSALTAGERIAAFNDMVMAPVSIAHICELFDRVAQRRVAGTFHFTSADEITYAQAGRELALALGGSEANVDSVARPPSVVAPRHAALDSSETARAFDVSIASAREAMQSVAEELQRL